MGLPNTLIAALLPPDAAIGQLARQHCNMQRSDRLGGVPSGCSLKCAEQHYGTQYVHVIIIADGRQRDTHLK